MSVSLNTLPQFKRGECLIAVIGDEDTCVGMLLAGFGQVASRKTPNFFVVDTSLLLLFCAFLSFSPHTLCSYISLMCLLLNRNNTCKD